jgi:hypothetical protein
MGNFKDFLKGAFNPVGSIIEKKGKEYKDYTSQFEPWEEGYYGHHLSNSEKAKLAQAQRDHDLASFTEKPPEVDSVKEDPFLRDQQMGYLKELGNIYKQGGFTDADRARMKEIEQQQVSTTNSQNATMQDALKQRGINIGSGAALAMQNANAQAAADRASGQGTQVAGMAADRNLGILGQVGQASGAIRGQDFGQAMSLADAKDKYRMMIETLKQQGYSQDEAAALAQKQMNLQLFGNILGTVGGVAGSFMGMK